MLITDLPDALLAIILGPQARECRLVCHSFRSACGPLRAGLRPKYAKTGHQLFGWLSGGRWHGITELDLGHVAGSVDEGIAQIVAYCFPSLRKLVMSDCARVNAASAMSSLAPLAVTLQELDLACCWMDAPPCTISRFLSATPLPALRSLQLPEFEWLWRPAHMDKLILLTLLSSLIILPLSSSSWSQLPSTTHVWSSLAALPRLTHLAITSCDTIHDWDAQPYLPDMSALTYLSLGPRLPSGFPPHQPPIHPPPKHGIAPVFPYFLLPRIRHLNLSSCHCPPALPGAAPRPPPPPTLQHLNLLFHLNDALLTAIAPVTSLTSLTITFCDSNALIPLPPTEAAALATIFPRLGRLHLQNPPPSFPYPMVSLLHRATSLTVLPLRHPSIHHPVHVLSCPSNLQQLALPCIPDNPSLLNPPDCRLTQLIVHTCNTFDADHISHLTQLEHLALGHCSSLTDCALQNMVACLPHLVRLHISSSTEATGSFCRALPTTLTQLIVQNCPLVTGLVLSQLTHLSDLRYLDLSDCRGVCGPPLVQIALLPSLETLVLLGCWVSAAFVEEVLLPASAHLQRLEIDIGATESVGSLEGTAAEAVVDVHRRFFTCRRLLPAVERSFLMGAS